MLNLIINQSYLSSLTFIIGTFFSYVLIILPSLSVINTFLLAE